MSTKNDLIPLVSSFGECNIPSYFSNDEKLIQQCTYDMSISLFKSALIINILFSLIFFKKVTKEFLISFLIFHIFLYFFVTILFVSVSVNEWRTYQAYKESVKVDSDFSRFDTPLTQFKAITGFLMDQPINKQKMIYLIFIVCFVFVWFPIMFNISDYSTPRFDLSQLKSKIPFFN